MIGCKTSLLSGFLTTEHMGVYPTSGCKGQDPAAVPGTGLRALPVHPCVIATVASGKMEYKNVTFGVMQTGGEGPSCSPFAKWMHYNHGGECNYLLWGCPLVTNEELKS